MNRILFLSIIFSFSQCVQIYSQNCETERYQKAVFTDVVKTENLVYSNADIYDAFNLPINFDFRLDVYEPAGDTREKRPMVIMQFGGAYIIGDKNHADIKAWCDSLARYGYVAVSIDYRLGLNALSSGSAVRAMYRGVQDTRAAIRYMLEHENDYRIDPNHIFLGGESAGAINSMHAAFMTSESERPQETFGIPLENFDMGCLDCSGNNFQHNFEIRGVIDLWGGVLDLGMITANEEIPVLLIHGEDDQIVPPDEGYPFLNEFQLTFPYLYASESIHNHLDALGIYNEYYPYPGEGHLFYGLPDGVITFPNDKWLPVWTQGHEFLYQVMSFETPVPSGSIQVDAGLEYIYNVPFNDGSGYCWEINGGTIIENNNNEIKVIWDEGMGQIFVSEINCIGVVGNEAELMVDATVSNENVFSELGVSVYPNLIRQGENIFIENKYSKEFDILIFNNAAQLIKGVDDVANNEIIHTGGWIQGVYFLVIHHEGRIYSKKIIVQ